MKRIYSEKVVERELVVRVRANGGLCIKLLCDQMMGLPDRMCLMPGGRIAFAETKTTGKKPRPIQERVHDKLRALGFRVEVIDTKEGAIAFADSLKE